MKTNLTKSSFSLSASKGWQRFTSVLIVAFLLSLFLMVPKVAQAVGKAFNVSGEKIQKTAGVVAFALAGLLVTQIAAIAVGFSPLILIGGLVIASLGVYQLFKIWNEEPGTGKEVKGVEPGTQVIE